MGDTIVLNSNGLKYAFNDKVKPESQQVILQAMENLYKSSNKNLSFFDGTNINVLGLWEDSEETNGVSYYTGGYTMDPARTEGKNIYIKTNKSLIREPITSWFNSVIDASTIKCVLFHELGHVFDNYFSTSNESLKTEVNYLWKEYISTEEGSPEEKSYYQSFLDLYKEYIKEDSLSDSDEFKNAWKEDVENSFKGKNWLDRFKKNRKLGYFNPTNDYHYPGDRGKEIELEDGISNEEVDFADGSRREVFAQCFAYAIGTNRDDKEKEIFLSTYSKCYEVVKNYINEYLGIDVSNEQKQSLNLES